MLVANEATLNASINFLKDGVSQSLAAAVNLLVDVAGNDSAHLTQNIGASEEALKLGNVTTPGWFHAINRGSIDTISIRAATGLADLVRMGPGEPCLFKMDADASAPFAISSGSESPLLEYVLIEA